MTRPGETPRRSTSKIQQVTSDLFVLWCVACGLPRPEREYQFYCGRRWRFDYAWPTVQPIPGWLVAVEVEGGVFTGGRHTRGAGFVKDLEKYNAAALEGWIVLRYTPQQLMSPQTLQDLQQALGIVTSSQTGQEERQGLGTP